ncbi:MAG: chromate transporter [Clostridia bacterium]|nr:chromate transporter [Clostridia bacterium]
MIYIKLFYEFFKIGLFTFGGGYAMIPIVRDTVIKNGWLTDERFLDFLAVSESTPGPVAINMATFVGSSQAGLLGSILATLGVVLPSFIIILIIAAIIGNFLKKRGVEAFLKGVRPSVVALIISAGITLGFRTLLGFTSIKEKLNIDYKAIIIFAIITLLSFVLKKIKRKKPSPIILIITSAFLGIVIYGI